MSLVQLRSNSKTYAFTHFSKRDKIIMNKIPLMMDLVLTIFRGFNDIIKSFVYENRVRDGLIN